MNVLRGGLNQPTVGPLQQQVLGGFFGGNQPTGAFNPPPLARAPGAALPQPAPPQATPGVGGGQWVQVGGGGENDVGGGVVWVPNPTPPAPMVPQPNFPTQGPLGTTPAPSEMVRATGSAAAPVSGQGGFFGQGQNFLGGLLQGQLPPSLMQSAQRNLELGQQGLNSELQKRGAFFSSHGLEQQRQLSENVGRDLNNMVFQNAMQAIPQGLQLFGAGSGLAGIPDQPNPALQSSIGLLGALRGSPVNPQYQPDPFTDILTSIIPFLF